MPARRVIRGVTFHRPLLAVPAAVLRAWLASQGVAHVEDPSNADESLTRNRIRARLLPAWESAFPQFRDTIARSARRAARRSNCSRRWRNWIWSRSLNRRA